MESSINSSNDTNITELLDESYYNDISFDVPLVATYLKTLLLSVTIPAIIFPPVVIIHIIRKTKELHTKYCRFLVNLLISDILTSINYSFEIFIMILYLLNISIYVSDRVYVIITIPQVASQYCFILLAIDRVVGVAFPYRYRNIMKLRVVYALIASVWIIAAVLLFLVTFLGSPYLVWPFGTFVPPGGVNGVFILYMFPQIVSAILIVGTNAYLYRKIIQSKKKLESNLKLCGRDDNKTTKLQRLIHNLQMQLESSLPVFVLGGVDFILIVSRSVIFIIINAFYPPGTTLQIVFVQFFVIPLEYCQIISHSITYGIYKTEVRKKLHQYYQHHQRLLPLRPSKVVTLHPQ